MNTAPGPRLRVAQISDSHLGPTRDFTLHGHKPYDALKRVITAIVDSPAPPDIIIHTGDMSQDRSRESYSLLLEATADCTIPIYYLNGNHDSAPMLNSELGVPLRSYAEKPASADYRFDAAGQTFLVLDSWHPDQREPLGRLCEPQLDWLGCELETVASAGERAIVCLHHAPFPTGSPWLDDNMIITNGGALHTVLAAHRDAVHVVIHGHLHRAISVVRDGVTYAGTPSLVWQYLWEPWRIKPAADPATPPMYTMIDCFVDRVQLSQYAF